MPKKYKDSENRGNLSEDDTSDLIGVASYRIDEKSYDIVDILEERIRALASEQIAPAADFLGRVKQPRDLDPSIIASLRQLRRKDIVRFEEVALDLFGFSDFGPELEELQSNIAKSRSAVQASYAVLNRGNRLLRQEDDE